MTTIEKQLHVVQKRLSKAKRLLLKCGYDLSQDAQSELDAVSLELSDYAMRAEADQINAMDPDARRLHFKKLESWERVCTKFEQAFYADSFSQGNIDHVSGLSEIILTSPPKHGYLRARRTP